MNKNVITIAVVAFALVAAGTIYAMQNKGASLDRAMATNTSTTRSSEAPSEDRVVVPNGTALRLCLSSGLSTKTNNMGDTF